MIHFISILLKLPFKLYIHTNTYYIIIIELEVCACVCGPIARIFERGVLFLGGGLVTYFSLIIHEVSNMYYHFVVTHPYP